jgi:hypothetical protein
MPTHPREKLETISTDDLKVLVAKNRSYAGVLRDMEIPSGQYTKCLKRRCKKESIDVSHIRGQSWRKGTKGNNVRRPLSDILVKNSTYKARQTLRRRLVDAGLLKDECAKCGIGPEWQNELLVLQLDHINGSCDDNRLKNLRLLCPNCHSQTDTYCGKNNKVAKNRRVKITFVDSCVDCNAEIGEGSTRCLKCSGKQSKRKVENRPSLNQIEQDLKELKSYLAVGRKYGVTDNTIRKWIRVAKRT